MQSSGGREVPVEQLAKRRWLQHYTLVRWVTLIAFVLAATLVHFGLRLRALAPVLGVAVAVAAYDIALRALRFRRERRGGGRGGNCHWRQRLALIQSAADVVAITVMLRFLGGVENPLFLFYLVHIGFASVMLKRSDALKVMGLGILLFSSLALTELLGWLPHVHLAGFAPPGLHQQAAYVVVLVAAFAVAMIALTVGLTSILRLLRAQTQQRALDRDEQLADLDRMRAYFLGMASHDLKTPLAVVSNYLQTILGGFTGDVNTKQRQWMERANLRVGELIRLIDDFVDVSQLSPDRIRKEMTQVSLADTLEESIGDIRHQIDEKGIRLRIDVPPRLPTAIASPRRLQRVVTNLLGNAVTCTPRNGEVHVQVRHENQCLRVAVVDSGPGIPRRYLQDVFEDYRQVRRTEFVPGAGLGLSTARRIIEAHGGTIWVDSPHLEGEEGCCFSFTLPCAELAEDEPGE
jgi:signal transduction histidine kinase